MQRATERFTFETTRVLSLSLFLVSSFLDSMTGTCGILASGSGGRGRRVSERVGTNAIWSIGGKFICGRGRRLLPRREKRAARRKHKTRGER